MRHALGFARKQPPPVQWELSWSDEFAGDTLNRSLWNARSNESHCCPAELELYVPEAVSVHRGQLVIRTQNRALRGPGGQEYNYSSGWVDTQNKWSQKLGRFEANCSLPTRAATGIWPAFWLMPDNQTLDKQCWPTGGEVDIFEMNGDPVQDSVFGSYHWARPGECGKDREPVPGAAWRPADSGPDWQTGWHVYAVEWREDRLDFFVDGHLYLTRTAGAKGLLLPTSPMYVIFDQAVDPQIFRPPVPSPQPYAGDGVALRVEYVRVYRSKTDDGDACVLRKNSQGENSGLELSCEDAAAGLVIVVQKANYGANCNEQCKCVDGGGCMPCCMHGAGSLCCPSCVADDKGNDFTHLTATCNGQRQCQASYGGDPVDPAGGCGKLYEYVYACCPPDQLDCCEGTPPAVQATITAIWIGVAAAALYLGFATLKRRIQGKSGRELLPHGEFFRGLAGLLRDGCTFTLSGFSVRGTSMHVDNTTNSTHEQQSGPRSEQHDRTCNSTGGVAGLSGEQASRSSPSLLHTATATGDARKLQQALLALAPGLIDQGDHKRYTAFHVACAGGHVACAEALLRAGCNVSLRNDTGLTGCELAESLVSVHYGTYIVICFFIILLFGDFHGVICAFIVYAHRTLQQRAGILEMLAAKHARQGGLAGSTTSRQH